MANNDIMRIAFYTLGCRSNQYETRKIKGELKDYTFEEVPFHEFADIYIINTCTVTSDGDKKSRQAARKAIKINPNGVIIITGCYVEREPAFLTEDSSNIHYFKNTEKQEIVPYLKKILQKSSKPKNERSYRVRRNLMIENGCENFCKYCIVPFVRGKIKSVSLHKVIGEAKKMASSGVREIILTGINLGTYGKDSGDKLIDVIKEISEIPEILRIRLSSIEPMYLTRALIKDFSKIDRLCPYFHIPLQSGDNKMLNIMGRNYTVDEYRKIIEYIREKIGNAAIGTDIIFGYPNERDAEFTNTVNFVRGVGFSRIHVFPFSPRPGTEAYKIKDSIDSHNKIRERKQILLELRKNLQIQHARQFFNTKVEVLVEKEGEGLTRNFIRVKSKELDNVGDLQNVVLTEKNFYLD
jgi:threonylcarbamoyladenosine tRNA methylthiotransferase MtaB